MRPTDGRIDGQTDRHLSAAMVWLPDDEKSENTYDRFNKIQGCDRQTDGRTDRRTGRQTDRHLATA